MPPINELRVGIRGLHALAARDLQAVWAKVSTAVRAREALEELLPLLVQTYGVAAATVAADWYDELRAELNVGRRFSAIVPEIDDAGADILARWGIGPLFSKNPDWSSARTLIDGGLQRRIANVARETIQLSTQEDPSARGWQRHSSGGCTFCQMLAGRGHVYSQASADFASHDHCHCYAVPVFDGHPKPVTPFTPNVGTASDADRARARSWLHDHQHA